MRVKTLFLTSFNPFITRNILFTDVFKKLAAAPNLQLVIFCPDYKLDYFRENFSGENIIIEPVKTQETARQDIFFNFLGRSVINTSSLRMHRKEIFSRNKNFLIFLFSYLLAFLGHLPFLKKIIRQLDQMTISKNRFAIYFDKYRPNLVFAPDVFHVDDAHFLAEARKRKIFTVGMIRSWDNITGKGLFRIKPDKLIVNNETIKAEAIKYEDMTEKDIFVGGLPQFDYYPGYRPSLTRDEFFQKIGLDPKNKLILFIPVGKRFYDGEGKVLNMIKQAIRAGALGNTQVLVRFPPNDDVDLSGFSLDKNFSIDRPGKQFQKGIFRDQEMTAEDMKHLANSLYYADVLAGYSSSMAIDGAAFGKPFVLVEGFDPDGHRPYVKSCVRFLDYYHVRRYLVDNGSTKLSKSGEEMIADIKNYLDNPSDGRKGRGRLLREQAEPLDGNSGKRIADYVLHQSL